MSVRPALLFYCQHSLGLGHLKRSWALAEQLAGEFDVLLTSGGATPGDLHPPEGINVLELPPLAQDAEGRLVVLNGIGSPENVCRERARILVDTCRRLRPAVVVIELFPFGRRKFHRELIALIEQARRQRPRPLIATSVRDLLVNRGADQRRHDDHAGALLDAFFDLVLVHTDPRFATLFETFSPGREIATPICHTGFVVPDETLQQSTVRRQGLLVSGGGGRFAERLYLSAIDAHDCLGPAVPPMTIVTGPLCPDALAARVCAAAETRRSIVVRRTVDDLCGAMRRAAVSVSQCGYNTALDIVRSRVPAVVVPFNDNGDSEQTDRAGRLERLNLLQVFRGSLDGDALAAAIVRAMRFSPAPASLDLAGARRTATVLREAIGTHANRARLMEAHDTVA